MLTRSLLPDLPMARHAPAIHLSTDERDHLRRLVRSGKTEQRLAERCRIVLLAADGVTNHDIAAEVGCSELKAGRWRRRYADEGFAGIENDRPRGSRESKLPAGMIARIIEATLHEDPPGGATHWSTRRLARHVGVSNSTVWQIWKAHRLKPHQLRTFKMSRDPRFIEKLRDVVGLYLDPPEHAIVFSADEKSQCQALERTQQRAINFDRPATRSHDYTRHGTTTLFAALCTMTGRLVHRTERRHTHVEWLRFLKQINREVERDLDVHIICDNYCTHKHAKVRQWLSRHRRFHIHFTPTSASWLNLVERFFSTLTTDVVRRGSFRSVPRLERTLHTACEHQNQQPTPYNWTATADEILAKLHLDE